MTREEIKIAALRDREIKIAASNYVEENSVNGYEAISSHIDSFIEGADWADKHPINVWHDASEEPICGKRLLLLHTNSVVSIFEYTGKSSWSMLVSCGICQYAYISELLPKGGSK